MLAADHSTKHGAGEPIEAPAQPLPNSVAARIAIHLPNADVGDRTDWPRQHAWIVAELIKFRQVFADRVKQLQLDEAPVHR